MFGAEYLKVSFTSTFSLVCMKVKDAELNTIRVRVTVPGWVKQSKTLSERKRYT